MIEVQDGHSGPARGGSPDEPVAVELRMIRPKLRPEVE